MGDLFSPNEMDIFKEAVMDDNLQVQIETIKKIPGLAQILGPEEARKELIPLLRCYIDLWHEEVLYHLPEELEKLIDYIGGYDFVDMILTILVKISNVDETVVREQAVKTMKHICDRLSNEQSERTFYPMIEELARDDWFTSKCSVTSLFAMCYPKVSEEKQAELLNLFRNLIQDESPMVRRASENALVDFIDVIDTETIKKEFVPVFDNLAMDEQDSVKVLSVDVGIAMAKKMKDFEIYDFLLSTFKNLSQDSSWRVRQRIAMKIDEIESVCGAKNSSEILNLYQNCVKDAEQEVRSVAAKNLYKFCVKFKENYSGDNWEKFFADNIMTEIHSMFTDESEDVRLSLSSNILSLSSIISNECFNCHILPLIIESLENEESMPFKENVLKNLNSLPVDLDITKSFKSITKVIQNLLENSQLHWRTRRNLLIAFLHFAKYSTKDFFDQNLRIFYLHLLNDPVYAIRRITPVILPLLVKQFGINWARNTLIPIFASYSKDSRYLYKYITLYGVEELIAPTLDKTFINDNKCKYLTSLREIIENSEDNQIYIEVLARIVKLHEKLSTELKLIDDNKLNDYISETLKLYGEDTLENLKKQSKTIFVIDKSELGDNICYLEGLLIVLLKEFVKAIQILIADPVENVRNRADATLKRVKRFVADLNNEIEEAWVKTKLQKITEEDYKRIDEEINEVLVDNSITEDVLDSDLLDDMVIVEDEILPDLGSEIPELEVNNNKEESAEATKEDKSGKENNNEQQSADVKDDK